jgi:basic amino acid/polyamine antiporter, APA family
MQPLEQDGAQPAARSMGFWRCWALTVGVMIGSGIYMLPASLAPFGTVSFLGWLVTGGGSILIALTLGHLATRTGRPGGPYAYAHDAFGTLTGFLVAWGYWICVVAASTAIAVAFAGYLAVFMPELRTDTGLQALTALAVIWAFTGVNIAGVSSASLTQLWMTLLKLVPLLAVIALALVMGDPGNIPPFNPRGEPVIEAMAATALLTMWAFAGLEAGTIPAGDVIEPQRTIPRAVVWGTAVTAALYIAATAAVMLLVPAGNLAQSTSPFADAATGFGQWGPPLIAVGALVSMAGALNGNILISGQMPMAVAADGLAPRFLARRNRAGGPQGALLLSSGLSSLFVIFNYTEGLVTAFTFLIAISTLALLAPLAVAALADIRHSWRTARPWALIAALAFTYTAFAILGSEREVLHWGAGLLGLGVPVFYWLRWRESRSGGAHG